MAPEKRDRVEGALWGAAIGLVIVAIWLILHVRW